MFTERVPRNDSAGSEEAAHRSEQRCANGVASAVVVAL